jgi:tRNA A-37 threonylcarbamoyl transferase component Bud32
VEAYLELRRARGDRPAPAEYHARLPDHEALVAAVFAGTTERAAGTPTPAPSADTARNLLFGILALQNEFITRDDLLAAFAAWVADRSRGLGERLRARGALDGGRHNLLGALVEEHLKLHGGDPGRSLAALGARPVLSDLERVAGPGALAGLGRDPGGGNGSAETMVPTPGEATPPEWGRSADYELLGELGRGGMGVVYKARQRLLNRLVALKMIRDAGHDRPGQRERFRVEAEAVARLRHPNIVQVYDVGEYQGQPFVALELLEGGSLAERVVGTPQPGRDAAALVAALAGAVEAAHRAGIVRRDLKPANILFAADGTPKVADFGLAKRLEVESGQTRTGDVVGTPSYMAPAQALGAVRAVGPATDVYALGAILYELLTGRPPFKGTSTVDTLHQVVNDDPVPPSRLQPKVARDLETIALKCLAKEPPRRYARAGDLGDDLRHHLGGEPIRARPTPFWERAAKWARRHPTAAALAAVALAGAVGLGAAAERYDAYRRDRLRQADKEFADRREKAYDDLDQGRRQRASGKLIDAGDPLDTPERPPRRAPADRPRRPRRGRAARRPAPP